MLTQNHHHLSQLSSYNSHISRHSHNVDFAYHRQTNRHTTKSAAQLNQQQYSSMQNKCKTNSYLNHSQTVQSDQSGQRHTHCTQDSHSTTKSYADTRQTLLNLRPTKCRSSNDPLYAKCHEYKIFRQDVQHYEILQLLVRSKHAYIPPSQAQAHGIRKHKDVRSICKRVLNKLSPDSINACTDKLKTLLQTADEQTFNECVSEMFHFGITYESYSFLVAQICRDLQYMRHDIDICRKVLALSKILFRTPLKHYLQQTEDQCRKYANATHHENVRNMHLDNIEDQSNAAKERYFQNATLFSEFFKIGILDAEIMQTQVLLYLINESTLCDDNIRQLLKVLQSCGQKLDQQCNTVMNKVISVCTKYSTREMASTIGISRKSQFIFQDILELRQRNWISRPCANAKKSQPMTIQQCHSTFANENRIKQHNHTQLILKNRTNLSNHTANISRQSESHPKVVGKVNSKVDQNLQSMSKSESVNIQLISDDDSLETFAKNFIAEFAQNGEFVEDEINRVHVSQRTRLVYTMFQTALYDTAKIQTATAHLIIKLIETHQITFSQIKCALTDISNEKSDIVIDVPMFTEIITSMLYQLKSSFDHDHQEDFKSLKESLSK